MYTRGYSLFLKKWRVLENEMTKYNSYTLSERVKLKPELRFSPLHTKDRATLIQGAGIMFKNSQPPF